MNDLISLSIAQPRFRTLLFSSLGVLALIRRDRAIRCLIVPCQPQGQEFGVRIALGATRRDIIHLVISGGMRLVGAGLVAGVFVCSLARGSLRALVFGIEPIDPGTWDGRCRDCVHNRSMRNHRAGSSSNQSRSAGLPAFRMKSERRASAADLSG